MIAGAERASRRRAEVLFPEGRTLKAMAACAACSALVPPEARFCPACGAPVTQARETRKVVSVLFLDWVGSTRLGERLDAESLRRIQTAYFAEARTVVERHGGTIEKFIGDAVMAVFGIPRSHEDDALRAVRAAVDLREALAALNEQVERQHGARISVRTGVNTGEVVASDSPVDQAFVTGAAVVVAKRLEEAAMTSEILISEATYRLVRNAVLVEPIAEISLKGKARPVPAWRLLGVLAGAPAFERRLDARLVGRERELALLRDAFARASSHGSGHFFTLLGSAGLGKSRLLRELITSVEGQATVLSGRCLPYGDGITYWPFADAMRGAGWIDSRLPSDEARRRIVDLVADDPKAELIAQRIAASIGLSNDPVSTEETFWAMGRLLESVARSRPVVLSFDDIHWGEEVFLDLVEYLGERTRDLPLLLVCLARPELLERRPQWAGGKLNATSILLEPLTEGQSGDLIDDLKGDADLPAVARRRILTAAEGNPLFVEQMVALVAEREEGEGAPEIPPTIQALLAERLDRLSSGEREVLEQASVIGMRFWEPAVIELSSEHTRSAVGTNLQLLIRKELIRPDVPIARAEKAFRFRHLLIRDAAYAGLPKRIRADLHERFALWIERHHAERLVELEEILAYHLEQASRYLNELGGDEQRTRDLGARARERLAAAGRRAVARGDASAATNLLGRAKALLREDVAGREELLADLGAAFLLAGDFAGADAALTKAVEVAGTVQNQRLELHARLELAFLRALTNPEGGIDELRTVAEGAISGLNEVGDDLGLAKAWRRIADVHWMMNQWDEQEQALERSLVHAERAGDRREAAGALMRVPMAIYYGPTPVPEAIRRAEAIFERARDAPIVQSTCLVCLAGLHALAGRFAQARDLLDRGSAISEELGFRVWLAGFSLLSSEIEMLDNDPASAERELRRGYRALEEMGERGLLSMVAAELARAIYSQERLEESERFTQTSEELAGTADAASQISWRAVRAKILARRGEYAAGEALAREAVALAERTDGLNSQGRALMDLAEVLEVAARVDEARSVIEQALQLFQRKQNAVSAGHARAVLNQRDALVRTKPVG
jgi:class 3 adenylate cyclase/tetratricopeptide (TPR) repeat protein